MIQAIIFDVGGVLIRTEDYGSRRALEKKLGLAEWESEQIVFNSEMGQKAQRGEISDRDLWRWVGERLQLSPDGLRDFKQAFWDGDVLDSRLISFIRQLRSRYQTAVISNATDGLRPSLAETYGVADAFDLITVSAEEEVMKPRPEIYERTMARLGRLPQECVFVDDFAQNIAAARDLGMKTVRFTPQINLPAELERLGVNIKLVKE
ncbi:MAG: HAD family hydrolase [Anaerolineae bacterium]